MIPVVISPCLVTDTIAITVESTDHDFYEVFRRDATSLSNCPLWLLLDIPSQSLLSRGVSNDVMTIQALSYSGELQDLPVFHQPSDSMKRGVVMNATYDAYVQDNDGEYQTLSEDYDAAKNRPALYDVPSFGEGYFDVEPHNPDGDTTGYFDVLPEDMLYGDDGDSMNDEFDA